MDLTKQFFKYVSQNIFGLLGTSCYILADTYFISQVQTALPCSTSACPFITLFLPLAP